MTSWWYFIAKNKGYPLPFVIWEISGMIIKSILAASYYRKKSYVQRTLGHFRGVQKVLLGQALDKKGFSK